MHKNKPSYKEAYQKPSDKIWCGCGDGRKRICGRIHNFGTWEKPDFRCWMNNEKGCPNPIPLPKKNILWSDG